VLIVDEALAVGDAAFQRKCFARLESLTKSGTTLFLVTHDVSTVRRLCTASIYLSKGQIKACGDVKNVTSSYMRDLFPEQQSQHESSLTSCEKLAGSLCLGKEERRADFIWERGESAERIESFGSGFGSIDKIEIWGLKAGNVMPANEKMRIRLSVSWKSDLVYAQVQKEDLIPNIYFGYSVANQSNVQLFGANTYTLGLRIDPLDKDSACAIFEVDWPELQSGTYFLSAALSVGCPQNGTHLDWNDYAVRMTATKEVRGGLFYPQTKLV